jgi:hypothetical protein
MRKKLWRLPPLSHVQAFPKRLPASSRPVAGSHACCHARRWRHFPSPGAAISPAPPNHAAAQRHNSTAAAGWHGAWARSMLRAPMLLGCQAARSQTSLAHRHQSRRKYSCDRLPANTRSGAAPAAGSCSRAGLHCRRPGCCSRRARRAAHRPRRDCAPPTPLHHPLPLTTPPPSRRGSNPPTPEPRGAAAAWAAASQEAPCLPLHQVRALATYAPWQQPPRDLLPRHKLCAPPEPRQGRQRLNQRPAPAAFAPIDSAAARQKPGGPTLSIGAGGRARGRQSPLRPAGRAHRARGARAPFDGLRDPPRAPPAAWVCLTPLARGAPPRYP